MILEEARRHVGSAGLIRHTDPNGAYQLLYDALRKAISAAMAAEGLRARNHPGAHVAVGEYGSTVGLVERRRFGRIRKNRHRSEYELAFFDEREIQAELGYVESVLDAATSRLRGTT
jgi:hypothetical protein